MQKLDQKGIAHLALIIFLVLAIGVGVYLAQKTQIFTPQADEQKIDELTEKIESGQAQVADAVLRTELLNKQLENNPDKFIEKASLVDTQVASEFQPFLEKNVDKNGSLQIVIKDNQENKSEQTDYFLKQDENLEKLYFTNKVEEQTLSNLTSGDIVNIEGVAIDNKVAVTSLEESPSRAFQAPEITPPMRLAVILTKFQNTRNDIPLPTKAEVTQTLFGGQNSVKDFYAQNSFGNLNLEGTVFDRITMPIDYNGGCDYGNWTVKINEVLSSQNIDLSGFTHRAYVLAPYTFDKGSECFGFGWADLNGPNSWYVANRNDIYAHELGHNLGLGHANSIQCALVNGFPTKSIDNLANCEVVTYGDNSSQMGAPPAYKQFSGPNKNALNWISNSKVLTVTSDGTFTIAPPIENPSQSSNYQMLKIAKNDTGESYFFSFRQRIGYDGDAPAGTSDGTFIHIWNGNPASDTLLVYPNVDEEVAQRFNYVMYDGGSFIDQINGIKVTQLSHTQDSATLKVEFINAATPLPSPTIMPSPTPVSPNCICNGATYPNNPISTNECNLVVCGTDRQNYQCTTSGFVPKGGVCGQERAAFYEYTAPEMTLPAKEYGYKVKVTNTGSKAWTAQDMFRLGVHFIPADQDNDSWGGGWVQDERFNLPEGVVVNPGQSYTFDIKVHTPNKGGEYVMRTRMVQEAVAWFDQVDKKNVTLENILPYNSAFTVGAIPYVMNANSTYNLNVQVQNKGYEVWTPDGPNVVRLGIHFIPITQDNNSWGTGWVSDQRYLLPPLPPVQGQPKIYNLNIQYQSPSKVGIYMMRIRMVKEGVLWFDQVYKKVVFVK